MTDPFTVLAQLVRQAIARALGDPYADADPVLRPSDRADFQVNAAMSLAKGLRRPPKEVAEAIVAALDVGDVIERAEVAGPGFINLTLSSAFLADQVVRVAADPMLGVPRSPRPERVVVDYSGPNVAKEMHVGHLRSTVIGDALVRVLEFLGHEVIRQNHVGDWGTQFGMLIEYLLDRGWTRDAAHTVADLNALYREAKVAFDADEEDFADRARRRVVALQAHDPVTLDVWRRLVAESERHFGELYRRLGVRLVPGDYRGESSYNDLLQPTVDELDAGGLLRVSNGAVCVFPEGFTGRDGEPLPMIVRKGDGGFGYVATDLAAIRYRVGLGAHRILYVVDTRQEQHFAMLFAVATAAGWLDEGVRAEHVNFGQMLGADGTPFKTRSGSVVRLVDLIDAAVDRARGIVDAKSPDLSEAERDAVANAIGVGAVKYVDLSSDRTRNYVFALDRMLAMDGDTAPYLQYAHARIHSLFRRAATVVQPDDLALVRLDHPAERALALVLLDFPTAVQQVAEHAMPHRLCAYLYRLAGVFTAFYTECPVLKADDEKVTRSRLVFADLTARVLAQGLGLLGIEAPARM